MLDFAKKNKNIFYLAIVFGLVCFGFMLTNPTISIDEESLILMDEPLRLWLLEGRYGIQLFNELFTINGEFVPFLWDFLSVVIWGLSSIIFLYCFEGKNEWKAFPKFAFCAYYISLPFVVGEVLSFSMYNLQVALGMACCATAFYLTLKYVDTKEKKYLLMTILLLTYSFSVYQAFVCVYISSVIAYCLLTVLRDTYQPRLFYLSAGLCAGCAILYFIINKLVEVAVGGNPNGYLSGNYLGWFSEDSVFKAGFMALANIARVSFAIPIMGVKIYGGSVIRFLTIAFILYSIYIFAKAKDKKKRLRILFFTVALVIAPFSLYIVLGTYKTHGRMLLALPLVGGIQLLLFNTFNKKWLSRLMVAITCLILFINARNMNNIFYYDTIVYNYDRTVTQQVIHDIKAKGYDYKKKPIVFIGMLERDQGLPIETSGTIGGSFFTWDDGKIARIRNFMRTEGYNILYPSREQIQEGLELKGRMQPWPQENSIMQTDDTIVVYFSEPTDKWYWTNGAEKVN